MFLFKVKQVQNGESFSTIFKIMDSHVYSELNQLFYAKCLQTISSPLTQNINFKTSFNNKITILL